MTRILSSRLLRRFSMLLLIGFCVALWPLAGYAATILLTSPEAENGVDGADQIASVVTKSASTTQATAGDTITYTYVVTNTGTQPLTIVAVDNRLGPITGLAVTLPPGTPRTASVTYVVQATDPVGPLSNTVTVTGTAGTGATTTSTAQAVVLISAPTDLPVNEQPQQSIKLFMPAILE